LIQLEPPHLIECNALIRHMIKRMHQSRAQDLADCQLILTATSEEVTDAAIDCAVGTIPSKPTPTTTEQPIFAAMSSRVPAAPDSSLTDR
jgi:hypothetical protein